MKTKKFYTISELANMFFISQTATFSAREACEKFPDDDFLKENLEIVQQHYKDAYELIESLNVMEDVMDYIGGLNKEIGSKKIYVKKGE